MKKNRYIIIDPEKQKRAKLIFDSVFTDLNGNTISLSDVEPDQGWIHTMKYILDLLWDKNGYVPSKINAVNNDFDSESINIEYIQKNSPPWKKLKDARVIACVSRENRNNHKIYITPYAEIEGIPPMDLHEKGHIKFNHTVNTDGHKKQFAEMLEVIWDQVADYFSDEIENNPENKNKIINFLFNEFSNIAQDMEINSKFFGPKEWEIAKELMARQVMLMYIGELNEQFDSSTKKIKPQKNKDYQKNVIEPFNIIINNFKSRLDKKYDHDDFQFCYPTNKGWSEGMDWMVYMALLVKDFDSTMNHVLQQLSDKTENGLCDKQKKIGRSVLNSYCEDIKKAAEAMNGENFKETDGNLPARSQGSDRKGSGSSSTEIQFETIKSSDELKSFFTKKCLSKKRIKSATNIFYYSNRKKMAGNVITPKRYFEEKWCPEKAIFLIDVSGSVPSAFVEHVVNTIIECNQAIDLKKSRIVFCDTDVVLDEVMSERTKKIYAGGGTDISNGISYVRKYMNKKTDVLFIISDLMDDLTRWTNCAEKIPGTKWVIGYGHEKNSNLRYSYKKILNDTFNTLFIDTENWR